MIEPDHFALTLRRSASQWSEPRISRGAIVKTIKAPKAWLSLLEKPSDIRSADLRDYDPQTRPFEMKSNKIQSVKDYSPPTFWRWIPHNLRPLRTATLAD
jgi:hypothetical protein